MINIIKLKTNLNNYRSRAAFFILLLVLSVSLVSANGAHNFEDIKGLIESKVSCDKLSEEQLEAIGEYYMEQMHPAESHELMHKMMGLEEGSKVEEQFHINMANVLYCGKSGGMMSSGGMMGMMNMMGGNMMGLGMMGGQNMQGSMMGYSTLGYTWNLFNVLYLILLIGLIVLVWLGVIKLWRTIKK